MFYKAKGGTVKTNDWDMYYVTFGKGETPLVILPGLSDGLTTVHNKQILLANYYKMFAKDFKVYVFSRRNNLLEGFTTKDMAADLSVAMQNLGIEKAHIFGISQGGMIAQHFAIDYPEMVVKLVLGVTISKQNDTIQTVVKSWIDMAEKKDYKSLTVDTLEKTYTEKQLEKYRKAYPIITKMNTPKDNKRFIIQANACITHDAYAGLKTITAPTLVLGGNCDKVVGLNTSEEIAEQIENSQLIIYKGFGHSAYEECKDFNKQVLEFLVK